MQEPTAEEREAWDLAQIHQRRSRLVAKPIGSVVRNLLSSSGYAESQAAVELQRHWTAAVGPILAPLSRVGNVSRGTLLVVVANSATMQELHLQKRQLLSYLQTHLPNAKIKDLRIRVGDLGGS